MLDELKNRLGEESRAWEIITYALSFERVGVPRPDRERHFLRHVLLE